MRKNFYIILSLFCFMTFTLNTSAVVIDFEQSGINSGSELRLTTSNVHKIHVVSDINNATLISSDEEVFTVDASGNITPHKDGMALLIVSDEESTYDITVIVTAFNTLDNELTNKLGNFGDITVKYAKDFKIYNSKDGNNYYLNDYLWAESLEKFGEAEMDIDVANGKIKYYPYISLEANYNSIYRGTIYKNDNIFKVGSINFAKKNNEHEKQVAAAAKNIKPKYYSYLNKTFDKMFRMDNKDNQKLMLEASNFYKDLNNKNIDVIIDTRKGDDTPGRGMFGGNFVLGMNGVYYGGVEVEIYQMLQIPKVKNSKDLIKAIREYFEQYLISESEEVKIEEFNNNGIIMYKATITKKENNSPLAMIANFLLPNVYADDEKVVEFQVEQVDNEDVIKPLVNDTVSVPKTGDNILLYVGIIVLSVSGMVVLNKKKCKNN